MVGIYKITNLVNGKAYIGLSINIERRWLRHKHTAFNPNYPCYEYPLYKAIRKYGIDNFSFEIVEECDSSELSEKEIYYISLYDTYYNGYNQDKGGSYASHFTKLSEEMVDEIIELLKTSKENSDLIGAEFGITGRMIRGINSGDCCHKEGEVYPIRPSLYSIDKQEHFCETCGVKINRKAKKYCVECAHLAQRKVERPSPLELAKMIKENGFANTGRYFGVDCNTIKKWCKFYQIPHKIKELIAWYNKQMGIVEIPEPIKVKVDPRKSVEQIDLITNKVIAVFESANAAARHLGKKKGSHISEVCNGIHETAHGYKWRYIA